MFLKYIYIYIWTMKSTTRSPVQSHIVTNNLYLKNNHFVNIPNRTSSLFITPFNKYVDNMKVYFRVWFILKRLNNLEKINEWNKIKTLTVNQRFQEKVTTSVERAIAELQKQPGKCSTRILKRQSSKWPGMLATGIDPGKTGKEWEEICVNLRVR